MNAQPARPAIVAGLVAGLPEHRIARALDVTPEYVGAVRRDAGIPRKRPTAADRLRRGDLRLGQVYLSGLLLTLPDCVINALVASAPPGATLADHLADVLAKAVA